MSDDPVRERLAEFVACNGDDELMGGLVADVKALLETHTRLVAQLRKQLVTNIREEAKRQPHDVIGRAVAYALEDIAIDFAGAPDPAVDQPWTDTFDTPPKPN